MPLFASKKTMVQPALGTATDQALPSTAPACAVASTHIKREHNQPCPSSLQQVRSGVRYWERVCIPRTPEYQHSPSVSLIIPPHIWSTLTQSYSCWCSFQVTSKQAQRFPRIPLWAPARHPDWTLGLLPTNLEVCSGVASPPPPLFPCVLGTRSHPTGSKNQAPGLWPAVLLLVLEVTHLFYSPQFPQ